MRAALALVGTGGVAVSTAPSTLLFTLTGASTIDTTNSPGTNTVGTTISGNDTLIKAGPNALTLSGSNNYSGGTVVAGGTLIGVAATDVLVKCTYYGDTDLSGPVDDAGRGRW